jgi:ectoine hydroxylase-related dioxygenase (phytanoyl-CoA dioxygenase family)
MCEAVVAFKDKLNYKQPGGGGFAPHQDVLAYPGVDRVVSVLVAVDDCSVESGCLWVAPGVDRLLPVDDRGVIRADVVDELAWEPIELAAGETLCIDGLLPHRSDANHSASARRVLIASYAPASSGYERASYYARRREVMEQAAAADGRVRISTLADFLGDSVAAVDPHSCHHPSS